MLDTLLWWRRLSGSLKAEKEGEETRAVLVYGGDDAYERRGISVRPWFSI